MAPGNRIDILYFSKTDASVLHWDLGGCVKLSYAAREFAGIVNNYLATATAEWALFWDDAFGQPDSELIKTLAQKPVDAWHSGLRLGLQGKPHVLDYVQPIWMYNKDAAADTEHTSFRLSIRAALIRTSVLKHVCIQPAYRSLEMLGVALGYNILKKGGVIRYQPALLKQHHESSIIPITDEWLFAKEFFPLKWQLWTLINQPNHVKNLAAWLKTQNIKRQTLKPAIHSSKKEKAAIPYAAVSVLAPTLNRYSYLLNELAQLSRQTVLPHEVLITDQTDEAERIDLDFTKYPNLNIRYFPQSEKGQCTAWNKMLEEATGEYVLFLGDDADDIKPDFIEKLLLTQQRFDCDMVASNVIEAGIEYGLPNEHYYVSDTFPIALIKKEMLLKAGFFDMFFNKNIRADHDVAMRCHLQGALMIFDASATIFHHRAPVGGLRTHNARAVTSNMAKKSVTGFLNPTSSEIYLAKKYYTPSQVRSYIKIKYLNQLFIKGSLLKKIARLFFFIISLPSFYSSYRRNEQLAQQELNRRKEIKTGNPVITVL